MNTPESPTKFALSDGTEVVVFGDPQGRVLVHFIVDGKHRLTLPANALQPLLTWIEDGLVLKYDDTNNSDHHPPLIFDPLDELWTDGLREHWTAQDAYAKKRNVWWRRAMRAIGVAA